MDSIRFDGLTRAFAGSRRGFVKALAGSAIAGVAALTPRAAGAKPKDPFHRAMKRCQNGQPCGALAPCTLGVCLPTACEIDGVIHDAGAINPANNCEYCSPTANWRQWRERPDETVCGDPIGDPCISDFSTCLGGECVPQPLPDGHECGPGQICCGGACCASGSGCGAGGCEPQGDCTIDGVFYINGEPNPEHDCQICDADVSTTAWSPTPDHSRCGAAGHRFCCNGTCCAPDNCCGDVGLCSPTAFCS